MTDEKESNEWADEVHQTPSPGGERQTQRYLRELLEANGLRPRRQLGQNFLIDLNLLDLLVRSAGIGPDDVVLEVGAGTGGLTTRLAKLAKHVVAVEIDPGFHRLVEREVRNFENVTLLHTDALAGKNKMNPEVVAALWDAIHKTGSNSYRLVANLPYDVASSVVGNLLVDDLPIKSATIMVQYEVGLRMVAVPGDRDFGPISVLIQHMGTAKIVRTLPPTAFWPRPKVDSCIVQINVDPERRKSLDQIRAWHRFVRDLFLHRRKTLRSAIASVPGYKELKPKLDALLERIDLTGDVRAERLAPDELFDLWKGLDELRQEAAGKIEGTNPRTQTR